MHWTHCAWPGPPHAGDSGPMGLPYGVHGYEGDRQPPSILCLSPWMDQSGQPVGSILGKGGAEVVGCTSWIQIILSGQCQKCTLRSLALELLVNIEVRVHSQDMHPLVSTHPDASIQEPHTPFSSRVPHAFKIRLYTFFFLQYSATPTLIISSIWDELIHHYRRW